MPLLGGLQLPIDATAGGERQHGFTYEIANKIHTGTLGKKVFMNWNFYSFPVLQALKILDLPGCNPGGYTDFDMPLVTSAFFPNWYDNELSFYLNPDVGLLTIPTILAAAPLECGTVSITKQPVDKFWLSAGCWGNLVPYTGAVAPATRVKAWSLISARAMSMLSRLPGPMVQRTTGDDVVCKPDDMPILKKSQYKFSMLFPVPESRGILNNPLSSGDTTFGGSQVPELSVDALGMAAKSCAHPFGYPVALWGEWRSRPATGEDAVFLVWQWTDCCFGVLSGP
jgi:conjugal transfer pilus assembly protein TraU